MLNRPLVQKLLKQEECGTVRLHELAPHTRAVHALVEVFSRVGHDYVEVKLFGFSRPERKTYFRALGDDKGSNQKGSLLGEVLQVPNILFALPVKLAGEADRPPLLRVRFHPTALLILVFTNLVQGYPSISSRGG